jgi:hypothetical protein
MTVWVRWLSQVELAAHSRWTGWRHRSNCNAEAYAAEGTTNAGSEPALTVISSEALCLRGDASADVPAAYTAQ